MDQWFGGQLPRQQPNPPQTHPWAHCNTWTAMLIGNWTFQYRLPTKYYAQFPGFGSSQGQIVHVLLSRAPETLVVVSPRLACLSRISIAVPSSRISWNYSIQIKAAFRWFFLNRVFEALMKLEMCFFIFNLKKAVDKRILFRRKRLFSPGFSL